MKQKSIDDKIVKGEKIDCLEKGVVSLNTPPPNSNFINGPFGRTPYGPFDDYGCGKTCCPNYSKCNPASGFRYRPWDQHIIY